MASVVRFLSPLAHPLGLFWLSLALVFFVCVARRRVLGSIVSLLAWVLLWLAAQPPVASALLGRLERPWATNTLSQASQADAVIVLGGGWRPSTTGFAGLDLTPAADRWITGVELCRLGRAPVLVVGGDPVDLPPGRLPASTGLREWLRLWNFTAIQMETLGPVRTTREEAIRARELVDARGWRRILLVTSASHMRRSLATFERAGVRVEPVACDFQMDPTREAAPAWTVFPDEESLAANAAWWHEEVGWIAYRLLGYL